MFTPMLLIGADRPALGRAARRFSDLTEPVYSGYTTWRGVTTFDHAELAVDKSWGPGQRFGQVPMAHGEVYWFATQNAPADTRADGGEKAEVLRLFCQLASSNRVTRRTHKCVGRAAQ